MEGAEAGSEALEGAEAGSEALEGAEAGSDARIAGARRGPVSVSWVTAWSTCLKAPGPGLA